MSVEAAHAITTVTLLGAILVTWLYTIWRKK